MNDESSEPAGGVRRVTTTRRSFLAGSAALGGAVAFHGGTVAYGNGDVALDPWLDTDAERASIAPPSGSRRWLGPELWGNRLQDWRSRDGRIECAEGSEGYELRTVGLLTRELVARDAPGHLRVRTGVLDDEGGGGFAGFLIGVGEGELDYRAAALAQRSSGGGGGLLCTYGTDGRVRFRDHTDEENPVAYEELPADDEVAGERDGDAATDGVRLLVDLLPESEGTFAVQVTALDAEDETLLDSAIRRGVPGDDLLGGVSLVSSPTPGEAGARWWFDRLETAGEKVAMRPERTFGPIVGTLYSVNGAVLKLSAQLVPVGDADPEAVELRYRPSDGDGSGRVERATLGPGYTALFRVEDWDPTRAWDYEVRYEDGTGTEYRYEGRVAADPGEVEGSDGRETDGAGEGGGTDDFTIGLLGCTIACARQLHVTEPKSEVPQVSVPDRYSPGNFYFPYADLAESLDAQDPDLLVSTGDQFYEGSPSRVEDREEPGLDYLYKWFLWLWSFRDLTRNTPTVVMVDDHDVFQRDLWGAKGRKVSHENLKEGGYVGTAEAVERAFRVQTGHDPDPYDPTPVRRDIPVNYAEFTYGGTDFALLESRKFKLGPKENVRRDPDDRVLLGERQREFLAEWADRDRDAPAVCLTQTVFAGVRTHPDGDPFGGYDTNAYPPGKRDRALESLREAGALMLAGDQHLASLVRHGIDGHDDGPVQFTGPAGGTLYQRWFEPGDLPDDAGRPNTGRFEDGHGNEFRALAVANPRVSYAEMRERQGTSHVFDRRQKREGYGLVRVDRDDEAFVVECWPRTADPTDPDAEQFAGWPYRVPFDEAGGRE